MLRLAQASGHQQILAHPFCDNPAAAKILQRQGFRPTGGVVQRFNVALGGHAAAASYALGFGGQDCNGSLQGAEPRRAA